MSREADPRSADPPGAAAVLLLGTALAASLALSLQHVAGLALPGCGATSPCGELAGSAWGRLPWLGWPVAHVGSAFFLGLLLAWIVSGGRLPAVLRAAVGLGAAASVLLLGVMLSAAAFCPWCGAAHAANLGFAGLALRGRGGAAPGRRTVRAFALGFLFATLALALPEWRARRAAERQLGASIARLGGGGRSPGFRGRWGLGPERSPARIVVFTDYQCPDCRALERQLDEVARRFPEAAVSVKHFPFCSDCNRSLRERGRNPHPNACRAAAVAETAGLLGGSEGFWRLHRWLFARGGRFDSAELRGALPGLGFDPDGFLSRLAGGEGEANVAADVDEGIALGVDATPMVFVNGQELFGWQANRALIRAVESLLAEGGAPAGPEVDRPRSGLERLVAAWREARALRLPPAPDDRWLLGEDRSDAVEVVVWGDYLDAPTRELDARIRAFAATEPRVRYAFRLFPLESACNGAAETRYPGACDAALASAASLIEGRARHLAEHERLMAGAGGSGIAVSARAREALRTDIEDARRLRLHAVPLILVAGRPVARWRLEGQPVIETILAEALRP